MPATLASACDLIEKEFGGLLTSTKGEALIPGTCHARWLEDEVCCRDVCICVVLYSWGQMVQCGFVQSDAEFSRRLGQLTEQAQHQ